jgi:hypothetical protein
MLPPKERALHEQEQQNRTTTIDRSSTYYLVIKAKSPDWTELANQQQSGTSRMISRAGFTRGILETWSMTAKEKV